MGDRGGIMIYLNEGHLGGLWISEEYEDHEICELRGCLYHVRCVDLEIDSMVEDYRLELESSVEEPFSYYPESDGDLAINKY